MKIVIDGRFWGPAHTGLGVYTSKLTESLGVIDSHDEYYVLLRSEALPLVDLPDNFQKIVVEAPAYSFREQILVPLALYRLRPDLVHFASINLPILYFGKFVVTIHDLIKHQSRGAETSTRNPLLYWIKYLAYRLVFRWAVFTSCRILTPSKSVKADLLRSYAVNPNKITVTYEAGTVSKNGPEKKINLPARFGIYVGNAYPHKNLDRLLSAWGKVYRETGAHLVFGSGRSVFTARFEKMIRDQKAEGFVHFLGYLHDEELRFAYRRAKVYVFPSLAEGFGIPGLDAMEFSLPLVCSGLPVLQEVYGPAAEYFDPLDTTEMADRIIRVIKDTALRRKLAAAGEKQQKKYSWEKMARETLGAYEDCVSLRPDQ